MIKTLERNHFVFASQKGSHRKYKNPVGKVVIVPHPRKIIPAGTARSIVKQSGMDKAKFGF